MNAPRVLAFIEAVGVTGPARNLLDTAGVLDLAVATYRRHPATRAHHEGVDAFGDAFSRRGIAVAVIDERRPGSVSRDGGQQDDRPALSHADLLHEVCGLAPTGAPPQFVVPAATRFAVRDWLTPLS